MTNKKMVKKGRLHPRNLHHGRYDFKKLCAFCPPLSAYVIANREGEQSIDFSNADALRLLNQALLKCFYQVDFWQIPPGYLCPPIPGRADYIHYVADLLAAEPEGTIPTGKQVRVLDIGSGANCIYPILGSQIYNWSFVGTDIDPVSMKTAQLIVQSNSNLRPFIKLRMQKNEKSIFDGIIKPQDKFAVTMCNPPFHASLEKAFAGTARKVNNLNQKQAKDNQVELNFGGQKNELCCPGGEITFLKQMCTESKQYGQQVNWFTSLVSKSANIAPLKKLLTELAVEQIKVIKMSQGQKESRLIAWRFLRSSSNH